MLTNTISCHDRLSLFRPGTGSYCTLARTQPNSYQAQTGTQGLRTVLGAGDETTTPLQREITDRVPRFQQYLAGPVLV